MQFLTLSALSALALSGFAVAQITSEEGMVCNNLYGPGQNPAKQDPSGFYIVEPSICASIGGKLYVNDIVCCPKSDAYDDTIPYYNACAYNRGVWHWPYEFTNTKSQVVPPGWKCPK